MREHYLGNYLEWLEKRKEKLENLSFENHLKVNLFQVCMKIEDIATGLDEISRKKLFDISGEIKRVAEEL